MRRNSNCNFPQKSVKLWPYAVFYRPAMLVKICICTQETETNKEWEVANKTGWKNCFIPTRGLLSLQYVDKRIHGSICCVFRAWERYKQATWHHYLDAFQVISRQRISFIELVFYYYYCIFYFGIFYISQYLASYITVEVY